ncbi:BREX-1 system adenine-specific DNA-methyltransferase PglX [Verrucomicrobia bacterium LW23]|nr:BREX-1 system adenine-specific DNA-methyltransferase PglX [Verrucomicrobia bacterium LW23]
MNTSSLKSFAPTVRRQLMEAVTRKLDYVLTSDTPDLRAAAEQVKSIRREADRDRSSLIERVAYTWFNRLAAIRFLDARGWHPFHARVLTAATAEETQPELLKLVRTGSLPEELRPHTDLARLNDLLDGRLPTAITGADPQGEVYRHLVLAVCRFYHATLPFLFERLNDETELLLPDDLLTATSVAEGFRTQISDDDCKDVEILGWLYQFYISEKKDTVMGRNAPVPKEDIPAVTQLFTPHWIVRYLVENSLGRLWLLNRPQSKLREHMPYYIEEGPGEPPAWLPAWENRMKMREGDWRTWMWVRPNAKHQGDYDATLWYALTIDGYAYGRMRWGIKSLDGSGAAKVEEIERAGFDNANFEDLRYCLFLIQRGIKWAGGSGPTDDLEAKFHSCHAALCRAWDREWRQHTSALPDLSIVDVEAASPRETDFLRIAKPEDIRLLDPAAGSAHMLTYAFDLLVRIYEEEGYPPSQIAELILTHNLHGLDICPRAAQLAQFALLCKAREVSRSAFRRAVAPKVLCLEDVRFEENELRDYIRALGLGDLFEQPVLKLLHQFEEATNFGSLIQPCLDERAIADLRNAIETKDLGGQLFLRETHRKVLRVLEQAEALSQRYHVVVANPPYMGGKQLNGQLKEFAKGRFMGSKTDLFAMFIERGYSLLLIGGFEAMLTMQSWMFLSSFEELRTFILTQKKLISLAHLGARAFDSIGGEIVQAAAFIVQNNPDSKYRASYLRLTEGRNEAEKAQMCRCAITVEKSPQVFRVAASDYEKIPGRPLAYWVSLPFFDLFQSEPCIDDIAPPRIGMMTTDNDRFLRRWHELSVSRIGFNYLNLEEASKSSTIWFPYNKGGSYRKWAGNSELVVNWYSGGQEIKAAGMTSFRGKEFYFQSGISWGDIAADDFSCRYTSPGKLFDIKGTSSFPSPQNFPIVLSVLNSKVGSYILNFLNPTVSFQSGDIRRVPIPLKKLDQRRLSDTVTQLIDISTRDWDNFESSWDFRDHPLLRPGLKGASLEGSWRNWEVQSTAAIRRMQELETENNRLFIAAYGLEGELQPEVPEEQITLARADQTKDAAALISYAVGCMLGRYSLDQPGLILADAGATVQDYLAKVPIPTFAPDADGILPVLDGEWFPDEVVARTREFLKAVWGADTLDKNVAWLEQALGKDLRRYFVRDFYKNHLSNERAYGYKKRPIYWLVSSPNGSFQVLIYLHRYTRDTVNTILNRYLREFLHKLEARLNQLAHTEATSSSAREKTAARKEADKLRKALKECQDWEREVVLPLAQQRIALDLDDGVKTNYQKFPGLLAKIPGLEKKEE